MNQALVSVIIVTHNGEKYVNDAIESALAQDYSHKEVIVIDDGSLDGTAQMVKKFGQAIRYYYQPNQGVGAARNQGVRIASGQYLAFLDHDDFWEVNKLSYQMQAMTSEDPLIFTCVKQFICPHLSEQDAAKIKLDHAIMPGYIAGTLLISQSRFNQIGPFIEEKEVGDFIEWYFRVLENKVPVLLLDKILFHRRIHLHNMSRQQHLYSRKNFLKIIKIGLDRRRMMGEKHA